MPCFRSFGVEHGGGVLAQHLEAEFPNSGLGTSAEEGGVGEVVGLDALSQVYEIMQPPYDGRSSSTQCKISFYQ